jgi:single-strand DNA-binding protein
MRSINKVIIIGNLTRDPEMRQTPNGQNVTTFGIATNREWTTKDTERKSSAEFHECVAWAKLAEICANYLKKGHLIYVEGYLKTRSWDSPEGVKKFKTEIVVQDMIMLEKRKTEEEGEYVPEGETVSETNEESSPKETAEEAPEETPKEETPEETPESEKNEDEKESKDEEKNEENPIDKDLGL